MPDITLLLMAAVLVALIAYQFYAAKRRRAQAEERVSTLVPGVEVMMTSGLYGTLVSMDTDDNVALIEVAPKVILKFHTQAIRQAVPVIVDADPVADADGPELNSSSVTPMAEPESEVKKPTRKKPSSDSK